MGAASNGDGDDDDGGDDDDERHLVLGPNITYPGLQLKFATSPSSHSTWQ